VDRLRRPGLVGRLRRAVIPGLAFDSDRAGARELVAELGHRSLDLVKVSRSHHAEAHHLIRLANLDALLLEKGPEDQGIPEIGALNRPRHVHNGDTPLSCEAASGMAAWPVGFPAVGSVRKSGRVVAVAVPPCPVMSTRAARSLS